MSQFYEVRLVIEELCDRRAAMAGDATILEPLRADWLALRDGGADAARRGPDFVYADERFHRRLAEASG